MLSTTVTVSSRFGAYKESGYHQCPGTGYPCWSARKWILPGSWCTTRHTDRLLTQWIFLAVCFYIVYMVTVFCYLSYMLFSHFSKLSLGCCRYVSPFFKNDKDLLILHSQYHGFWWPGDSRSQGISSQGIDPVFLEYSSFSIWNI